MADWRFAFAFTFGQMLAAWHYAGAREGIMRGVGIFVLYAIFFGIAALVRRAWHPASLLSSAEPE